MNESHLYSVDPEGSVTDAADEKLKKRRSRQRARPKEPVPTDRMQFDIQKKVLRIAATVSRNGKESFGSDDLAAVMDITSGTAGLNNRFYLSLGLFERVGKGRYKPTEMTIQYANKHSFEHPHAGHVMAPAFAGSWFYEAASDRISVEGKATEQQIIETFAAKCETDDSYSTQYGTLLDWLEYVGLISRAEGVVELTDDAPSQSRPDDGSDDDAVSPDVEEAPDPHLSVAAEKLSTSRRAVVAISFELSLAVEDLAQLTSEQIAALFEGVGSIAAVKAALT